MLQSGLLVLLRLIVLEASDKLLHVWTPFFQRTSLLCKPLACSSISGTCAESTCGRPVDCVRHQHVY
jgi:hypothetical protein